MILIPSPPLPPPPPSPFLHPSLSSTSLHPFSPQSVHPPPINQPFLAVCWFPLFSLPPPLFSSSLRMTNSTKHHFDHLISFVTLLKLRYLQWMGKLFSIVYLITQGPKKSSLHCSPWKRDIIHRGEDLFVSDHVVNPLNQGHHIAEHVKVMEWRLSDGEVSIKPCQKGVWNRSIWSQCWNIRISYSGAGNFTNLPVFPSCHIYSYLGGRKKVHFASVLLLREKEEELKI